MFNFLRRFFFHSWFSDNTRHPWRAYRFHGGGVMNSPWEMNEAEACMWVANVIKGEVAYVDKEMGFIFYRPKE